MTDRDKFIAAVLPAVHDRWCDIMTPKQIAGEACRIADAVIKERRSAE